MGHDSGDCIQILRRKLLVLVLCCRSGFFKRRGFGLSARVSVTDRKGSVRFTASLLDTLQPSLVTQRTPAGLTQAEVWGFGSPPAGPGSLTASEALRRWPAFTEVQVQVEAWPPDSLSPRL